MIGEKKKKSFVAITNSLIGNLPIPIVPMLPNLSDGQTYFAFYRFALTMVDACCAREGFSHPEDVPVPKRVLERNAIVTGA